MADNNITGRLALITDASSGVGAACARNFAAAGVHLALTYHRDRARLSTIASGIIASRGGTSQLRISLHKVDVTKLADINRMFGEIQEQHTGKTVDILISNLGVCKVPDDVPASDIEHAMDANLRASLVLVRGVAEAMKNQKWGRIIFISSTAAHSQDQVNKAHYAAATIRSNRMMKDLAEQFVPHNICVNEAVHTLPDEISIPPTNKPDTVVDEEDEGGKGPSAKIVAAEKAEIAEVDEHQEDVFINCREESDDEFGGLPTSSQQDLFEKVYKSFTTMTNDAARAAKGLEELQDLPTSRRRRELCKKASQKETTREECQIGPQELEELLNTQILSEAAEAIAKSDSIEPQMASPIVPPRKLSPIISRSAGQTTRTKSRNLRGTFRSPPPPLRERTVNARSRQDAYVSKGKSVSFAGIPVRSPKPSRTANKTPRPRPNLPPSATQAFLENNLDDFLPSPSQELRELLSEVDDFPSNTQIAAELIPSKLKEELLPAVPKPIDTNYDDIISTQDLILSSQDLREISPSKPKSSQANTPKPTTSLVPDAFFDDFPSTQDLFLSPQDLAEIETPSRGAPKTRSNLASELRILLGQETAKSTTSQPLKPTNQTNKPHHDRRTPSKPQPAPQEKSTPVPTPKKRASKPRTKPRFFEEKEDDVFHAAVQESKRMAQSAPKHASIRRKLSNQPITISNSRQIEDENDAALLAALEESRLMAEASKIGKSVKDEGGGVNGNRNGDGDASEKRVLQRSVSTATDYGDDDFEGFDESELFDLC